MTNDCESLLSGGSGKDKKTISSPDSRSVNISQTSGSRLQCRKRGFHFIKTIYPENGVCSFARTFDFELYKSMLGVLYSKEERKYFILSPQFV